jgi:hypothetical protein
MLKPMIKATNHTPLSKEETDKLHFSLYLKNRKVKEISKIMDSVLLWPKDNLQTWAEKFSPEVQIMLDDLLEDAIEVFDGVTLDKELMSVFAEFTENLKIVTKQVQSVIITDNPMDA